MNIVQTVLLMGVLIGALGCAYALVRDCTRLSWLIKLLSEGDVAAARAFVAKRPGLARFLRERDIRI